MANGSSTPDSSKDGNSSRMSSSRDLTKLHRTRSQVSVTSAVSGRSSSHHEPDGDEDDLALPAEDAVEMQKRASGSMTFVFFQLFLGQAMFSYRRDPDNKHRKGLSRFVPDFVDVVVNLPPFCYEDKIWDPRDLVGNIVKDVRHQLWSQKRHLTYIAVKHTSWGRTKNQLARLAARGSESHHVPAAPSPSRLRYHVEPPTPIDDDPNPILGRSSSKSVSDSSTSPIARVVSRLSMSNPSGSTARDRDRDQVQTSPRSDRRGSHDPPDSLPAEDTDSEEEESGGVVTRGMKGLLGKLKKVGHRDEKDSSSPTTTNASGDDLNRTTSRTDRSRSSPLFSTSYHVSDI